MSNPGQAIDYRSLLKNSLQTIDALEAKLIAAERTRTEPIAVIGMSCRFPGGVDSPESFWQLLYEGRDAVTELPPDRQKIVAAFTSPDSGSETPAWPGGFLDNIDKFDPQLFGITPREATTMDPQQRLVLEVAWEALERAGIAPDSLAGSRTGVFLGISTKDYSDIVRAPGGGTIDAYAATGGAMNVAAGRVSFTLGLQGPAMAVDTACSSSLVAVHLAVQSLRSRESNLALAGGVNVILLPDGFISFVSWGMMAADGRCKTFDASADGFVRSEGCGIVALKRLSDAQADGDPILAVIRGSAVNQDGRSSGLTVPSGRAQQTMLQQALANAGLEPAQVQYIEAHGTGTAIGDPIEVEAIGAVFGKGRGADQPLYLGSVKSNIGHAESAAGIAGVIKTILALQHGVIPPLLHLRERSPKIPWPTFPIEIPVTPTPWPSKDGVRIAGVSGFGFSGTNAHVLLSSAPAGTIPTEALSTPARHILTLSAKNDEALHAAAARLADYLTTKPEIDIADVCYTANTGRAQLGHRLAIVAESADELRDRLRSFAEGTAGPSVISGRVQGRQPRVAFLFTGQGAQYTGMSQALYKREPVFRDALDRCAELLAPHLDLPLIDLLFGEATSQLDQTTYTQPALFALEYALSELWRSWGITPVAVLGHSVGEYVAAVVAGVLSLEDGLNLIAARGRLMGSLPAGGTMAAIFAPLQQVEAAIAPYAEQLAVAAVNGPEHTVISGTAEAVAAVMAQFTARDVRAQRLTVSHAFHSPLMEPILDSFERVVAGVGLRPARLPLISNLSGAPAGDEVLRPAYWRQHLREAVRFGAGVEALRQLGADVLVEVGPHPTLLGMAQQIPGADAAPLGLPSLRKNRDDSQQIFESLAQLYVRGALINWPALAQGALRHKLVLPTYPFQRQHYWVDLPEYGARHANRSAASSHLLGRRISLAHDPDAAIWEGPIDISSFPYLDDHRVQDIAVFPATAYMEMAMSGARELFGPAVLNVSEIEYQKTITFPNNARQIVQLVFSRPQDGQLTFEFYSRPEGAPAQTHWVRNVVGQLRVTPPAEEESLERPDLDDIRARCPEQVSGETFYGLMAERGNQWGRTFQGVERIWRGEGEALSLIRIPAELEQEFDRYQFHPAVADACGHVLTATISLGRSNDSLGGAFVGGGIDEAYLYRRPVGRQFWAYARLRPSTEPTNVLIGDVQVIDETGAVISETIGARLFYLDGAGAAAQNDERLYQLDWEPRELAEAPATAPGAGDGDWLIFADTTGVGAALAAALEQRGVRAVTVARGDEYSQLSPERYTIRPDEASDFQRLAGELPGLGTRAWKGAVHLWSLDMPDGTAMTADELTGAQDLGCLSVVQLMRAFVRMSEARLPRLTLVTRGTQATSALAPAQAPLWGLGRAIALEHAELWGGLVDLDPAATPEQAAGLLLAELDSKSREDQVAFYDGQRHVARLVRMAAPAAAAASFEPNASYLITGGLGGLGLAVAAWMVERGARRLVLMGRSPLPPRESWDAIIPDAPFYQRVTAIRAMEEQGATIQCAALDVADEAQLAAFFDDYRAAKNPPIRGVIHAAGMLEHRALIEIDAVSFQATTAAKLRGGWLLHQLLCDTPLDFFVLFSSASALLSSPRLAAYAAANAFLDALAHYRHRLGLSALSINWGLWSETGMATRFDGEAVAEVALRGMGMLTTAQGLESLERLIGQPEPHVAVLPVNWRRWQELYPALFAAPLLEHMASEHTGSARESRPALLTSERLREAGPADREALVGRYLIALVSDVTRLDPGALSLELPLSELGIDSLMTVELKNRIETDIGVVVPMVRLLEGPVIGQLAMFVTDLFGSTAAVAPVAAILPTGGDEHERAAELLANIDTLSDDQVEALLSQMLSTQE